MTVPQPPRHPAPEGRYPGDPYGSGPYPSGPVPSGPIPAGSIPPGPGPSGPGAPEPGGYGPGAHPPRGATAAPPPPSGRSDVGDVPLGELVGNVTRDLSTLMRQELALAQAEVKAEASRAGKAAGALGAAGFAGYMAVLFASISLWWALGHLLGNGWSALLVAVLWGIAGAVLYSTGRKRLREVNPTPERTVETLKDVPDALKGEVGGHR